MIDEIQLEEASTAGKSLENFIFDSFDRMVFEQIVLVLLDARDMIGRHALCQSILGIFSLHVRHNGFLNAQL